MGSVQLPKLKGFVESRRNSAQIMITGLSKYKSVIQFQEETPKGMHSWFGFPIIVSKKALFSTSDLRQYLELNGIETRPIICGNIALQPAVKMYKHRVYGRLENASHVMKNGLAVACHQSLDENACQHIVNTISSFIDSYL